MFFRWPGVASRLRSRLGWWGIRSPLDFDRGSDYRRSSGAEIKVVSIFFLSSSKFNLLMPKGYTYILLCEGDNLYTGSTRNIERRFAQHLNGEGANFTRKYKPIRIVYLEEHPRIDLAFYREKQIQRWSRGKKGIITKSWGGISNKC